MKIFIREIRKYTKNFDLFGKEPDLYYKGKSKKTSWMGRSFTKLYLLSYLSFLIYKITRLIGKSDITFYDTFTYSSEPPKIKITNENFYGGFALQDPKTYDVFIDEGIYFPKASFRKAEKKGDKFQWNIMDLELEPCKIEKFGSSFQETFKRKRLNNLYCFKNMDFILEGHFTYELYSFFYIQFFPCVNSTENKKCKPLEIIDYYLKNTFVSFQWQDIKLTPKNYSYPIIARDADIYSTVGKKMFKEIHAYFQIVNIETYLDFLGFDDFDHVKTDTYLKFDELITMNNIIENNIYETGESFCDFTLKLSENIRVERRTFTKLITILGDIGGLMEILFTFLNIISSLSVNILYEISLVNNIFDFNINKKLIILKEKKNQKGNTTINNDIQRISINKNLERNLSSQNSISENEDGNEKKNNEEDSNPKKTKLNSNSENLLYTNIERQKSRLRADSNCALNPNNNVNNFRILSLSKRNNNKTYDYGEVIINKCNTNIKDGNNQSKENIISKIKIKRRSIYCGFLFIRRRKTVENVLLDEGMNVIKEKLDIFNIFDIVYRSEKIHEKLIKQEIFEMSDECKKNLLSVNNKLQ